MNKDYFLEIIKTKTKRVITYITPSEIIKLLQGDIYSIIDFQKGVPSLLNKTTSLRLTYKDKTKWREGGDQFTQTEGEKALKQFYSKETQAFLTLLLL